MGLLDVGSVQLRLPVAVARARPRTWALHRSYGATVEGVLDGAVKWYFDLYGRLPALVRVCPSNVTRAREHARRQGWSSLAVVACGGILKCEAEVPVWEG